MADFGDVLSTQRGDEALRASQDFKCRANIRGYDIGPHHRLNRCAFRADDAYPESGQLKHCLVIGSVADCDNALGAQLLHIGSLCLGLASRRNPHRREGQCAIDEFLIPVRIGGYEVDVKESAQFSKELRHSIEQMPVFCERSVYIKHQVLETVSLQSWDVDLNHGVVRSQSNGISFKIN
jgi:hypothetical protein